MLKNELETLQETNPEVLIVRTGACRFCGQTAQVEAPENWEEGILNEAATELCKCIEAQIYLHEKEQKERAKKAIREQFGQQTGEVLKMLEKIADMIVEGDIYSANADLGNGLKAKISLTGKGTIKVERTKTEKATQEA